MPAILDTVLLLALPASGKSEVRKYMDGLPADQCREDLRMGPTLQLDDYPYVHFMHRIDDELAKRGWPAVFYKGPERPFKDEFEWGTLIHLLNEDYRHLLDRNARKVPSAAQHLLDRIDEARAKAGLPRQLENLPYRIRKETAEAMETEVAKHHEELEATFSQDRQGRTVIIEMARGGPNGAAFPLTPPNGYQYSISLMSEQILDRAAILYVWVTPEESRRKNYERARPDGQSSILFHGVPLEVMLGQYGCDDIEHMMSQSDRPGTVKIERAIEAKNQRGDKVYTTKVWHIPVARFDNRKDLTTFVRKPRSEWRKQEIDAIHSELRRACRDLAAFIN